MTFIMLHLVGNLYPSIPQDFTSCGVLPFILYEGKGESGPGPFFPMLEDLYQLDAVVILHCRPDTVLFLLPSL